MSTSKTVTRLPLPESIHTSVPVGSADVLPMLAAARWPDRTALAGDAGEVTFAELDRRITRLASGIRDLLGGESSVVVLSAALGPRFPIAYYAVMRSGNVVAPVNPRLGAEVLDRLLISVAARAAVLDRAMYDRVRPALLRLPRLEQVLLLDGPADEPGMLTCADVAERGDLLVEPRDRDENEAAAIVFGGGSAGYAKAARRTHHGLKVDAARTAAAHGLSERSVALNALPGFHSGHLNAAVWAGATQVLCGCPDPAVLAEQARRHDASHCYALPGGEHEPTLLYGKAVAS